MTHLVRAAGASLLLGLSGWTYVGGELQFAVAGVAVAALTELALALRVRRDQSASVRDRSRVGADQLSCMGQNGVVKVALGGKAKGGSKAFYVLLSRTLVRGCLEVVPTNP